MSANSVYAQIVIGTPTFRFSQICANSSSNTFDVTFTFSPVSALSATNQFIVELSDSNGSFTIPTTVFTSSPGAVTVSPATLTFSVPTTTAGEKYKLRIKSTSPSATSPESIAFPAYYKIQDSQFSINNFIQMATYCSGGSYVLTIDNPGTGSNDSPLKYPSLTYNWFKEPGLTPIATGQSLRVNQSGIYYVETNYGSCTSNSYSNRVTVSEDTSTSFYITSSINVPDTNTIAPGETLSVTTTTTAVNPTYQWYLNGAIIPDATGNTYNATAQGSYKVIITQQSSGCVVSNEWPFVINSTVDLNVTKIPNLISPNGDGINDTWVLPQEYGSGTNTTVVLISSSGEIVFQTNDYQNNWPEKSTDFKNVNPVYYYIITTQDQKIKKGSITIVK